MNSLIHNRMETSPSLFIFCAHVAFSVSISHLCQVHLHPGTPDIVSDFFSLLLKEDSVHARRLSKGNFSLRSPCIQRKLIFYKIYRWTIKIISNYKFQQFIAIYILLQNSIITKMKKEYLVFKTSTLVLEIQSK